MRLLDTTTFEIASNSPAVFKKEGYAILSHRWVGWEITFEQLGRHIDALRAAGTTPLESPQQDKIRGACQTARSKGIKWMWIDTCCIDKSSTSELSESLNSMFQWYRDAKLCITYLPDVIRKGPNIEDFNNEAVQPSVWFSRGWTLQELLAPRHLEFYDKNWDYMGDRAELAEQIEKITGIQGKYLKGEGKDDPRTACIATKFSWIAKRQTEREEDMTYSMLGLFGVTMDPRYGEGWGAFMRLQKELLSSAKDESLFAWKMVQADAGLRLLSVAPTQQQDDWRENEWGLLAPRPAWFKDCSQMTVTSPGIGKQHIERHDGGSFMRQQGVQISLTHELSGAQAAELVFWYTIGVFATCGILICCLLERERADRDDFQYALNCWDWDESGDMVRVRIWLRKVSASVGRETMILKRVKCTDLIRQGEESTPNRTMLSGIVLQPRIFAS